MRFLSRSNVHPLGARILAWLALVVCLGLDGYFVWSLARSPCLGLQIRTQGDTVRVVDIDKSGPLADSGLKVGDAVKAIDGMAVSPEAFLADRDFASTWQDQTIFDQWRDTLTHLARRGALSLTVQNGGKERLLHCTLEPLGWSRAWGRSWPLRLVGWVFLLVAWLIWRAKAGETALVNFVCGFGVFVSLTSVTGLYYVDYTWLSDTSAPMVAMGYFSSQSSFLTLYLGLVFPTPLAWLSKYPWVRLLPWLALILNCSAHWLQWFSGPLPTTYLFGPLALFGFLGILGLRLAYARTSIEYRQVQWSLLGGAVGFLPWILFSALPPVFGLSGIPQEIALLSALFTPVCLSLAMLKYRLLDVGEILDAVVLYGAVVVLLSLGEFAFLTWIGSRTDPSHQPMILAGSMAALILLYAPLRQRLAQELERFVGRRRPSMADALQHFLQNTRTQHCPWEALEATLHWALPVQALLWKSDEIQPSQEPGHGCERSGDLGFELGTSCPPELTEALWVPVARSPQHFWLVLVPRDPRGWSRSDLKLATVLSQAAQPLGALDALRHEHALKERALDNQRTSVLRELHDGLGSQIYGMTMLAHVQEATPAPVLQDRLTKLKEALSETQDSLRTGLNVLEAPPGALGSALQSRLKRSQAILATAGIALKLEIPEHLAAVHMDSRHVYSLLRAIQEALTNVARHSRSTAATVSATILEGHLHLHIADNGIGFDTQAKSLGHGIENIRHRFVSMGGSAYWESSPGGGTRLALMVPLNQVA